MQMFRSVSRVLAAAVSTACIIAPTPSLGWTFTVNGATCQNPAVDSNGNITINCSSSTNPVCTVSAVPSSLPASGGPVTITASNCGTISSWTGAKSGTPGTSTTWGDTIPANGSSQSVSYQYTVTGANGSASASVTEAGTGSPPPPPPTGTFSCANIPGITGKTQAVAVAWQFQSGKVSTTSAGGFNANDAFVFTITPPVGYTTSGNLGNFSISPTDQNAYNNRTIAISDTPCDFSGKMGPGSVKAGQEPNVYFSVGGYPLDKYGRTNTSNANLTPGQTYYVTVIQESPVGSASTCGGTCNVNYSVSAPGL